MPSEHSENLPVLYLQYFHGDAVYSAPETDLKVTGVMARQLV